MIHSRFNRGKDTVCSPKLKAVHEQTLLLSLDNGPVDASMMICITFHEKVLGKCLSPSILPHSRGIDHIIDKVLTFPQKQSS